MLRISFITSHGPFFQMHLEFKGGEWLILRMVILFILPSDDFCNSGTDYISIFPLVVRKFITKFKSPLLANKEIFLTCIYNAGLIPGFISCPYLFFPSNSLLLLEPTTSGTLYPITFELRVALSTEEVCNKYVLGDWVHS